MPGDGWGFWLQLSLSRWSCGFGTSFAPTNTLATAATVALPVILGEAGRHLRRIAGVAGRARCASRAAAAGILAFPRPIRVRFANPHTAIATPADYAKRPDHYRALRPIASNGWLVAIDRQPQSCCTLFALGLAKRSFLEFKLRKLIVNRAHEMFAWRSRDTRRPKHAASPSCHDRATGEPALGSLRNLASEENAAGADRSQRLKFGRPGMQARRQQ